ncbi:four helix bundle protein [Candidatus Peregrinibacteria bacterium]|nr:four helix bundle protein [Candidatus Peregrinibacteria bacterium]
MSDKPRFDLEDRTYLFAKRVGQFVKRLPLTVTNAQYVKQVVRSSGSIAANYIEANEAVSKDDFLYRIKISRKESKESKLWLRLVETAGNGDLEKEQALLTKEAEELMLIFSAIMRKSQSSTS